VGNNRQLLRKLVDKFFLEYPRLLEDVRTAVAARDASLLRRAAHTLKGSVGIFGAHEAVDRALRLEMIGKSENLNPGDAEEAWAALEQSLDRLRPALVALGEENI